MTKLKHLVATVFLGQAALSGALAFAQAPVTPPAAHEGAEHWLHEITGGTNSTLTFSSDNTRLGLGLGYKYLLLPDYGLQLSYDTNVGYTHQSSTNTTQWDNVFGVRYNIQLAQEAAANAADLSNRFFVDFGVGFQFGKVTGADSSTKFIYDIGLGKRFALSDRVSYSPRVSIRHVADQKMAFNITPISFSIFL